MKYPEAKAIIENLSCPELLELARAAKSIEAKEAELRAQREKQKNTEAEAGGYIEEGDAVSFDECVSEVAEAAVRETILKADIRTLKQQYPTVARMRGKFPQYLTTYLSEGDISEGVSKFNYEENQWCAPASEKRIGFDDPIAVPMAEVSTERITSAWDIISAIKERPIDEVKIICQVISILFSPDETETSAATITARFESLKSAPISILLPAYSYILYTISFARWLKPDLFSGGGGNSDYSKAMARFGWYPTICEAAMTGFASTVAEVRKAPFYDFLDHAEFNAAKDKASTPPEKK